MRDIIMKTIADLPKEEITHNMIFDLWFKDYSGNWFKVMGYNPSEKKYYLSFSSGFTRDELLKVGYAMYPKEV